MKTFGILAVTAALSLGSMMAQAQDNTPRVDKRETRQQRRIEQGAKSGELTKKEVNRLERREAKIKADEINAKADGKVTKAERQKLHKELNRTSKQIYRQKHDGQKRK
jgi:DNA repair exonuclease SbcCD nuclease subunit